MRLITRPSLSGVACATFITSMENIEQVIFANPHDIEDRSVEVKKGDVIANLPYHPVVEMWFDNHDKAEEAPDAMPNVKGKRGVSRSTARLVYEYYNSPLLTKFDDLLAATDKISSAELSLDEVVNPTGWVLLSFTLDPFMGLANFHGFANTIIASLKNGQTVEQILDMPDVKGRVNRYKLDAEDFKQDLAGISKLEENVIISDYRGSEILATGNRFVGFSLYPEGNVQIVITTDSKNDETRIRIGKSIFNHSCKVHLGHLASEFGGGGLDGAAGFSLAHADADNKVELLIDRLKGI